MTICTAKFALPDDVVPGDLHRLSYSWDEKYRDPTEILCERVVPWVLDFYSSKLTFEGGVPDGVRYVTCEPDEEEKEVPHNLRVVREGNSVSISTKNFGNIVGSFRVPPPAE
ncbi:MAG: hypothetical protein IKS49_01000 [Actinomycetaceae bacterium]|nr:hypothetical protein [Actinomycetaceae bacterium]